MSELSLKLGFNIWSDSQRSHSREIEAVCQKSLTLTGRKQAGAIGLGMEKV
jgi:hypothetical protein